MVLERPAAPEAAASRRYDRATMQTDHGRPGPELSAVDHPEVDVRALQAEVRAAAARARGSNVPEAPTAQEPSPSAEPRRHALHRTAEIRPYQALPDGPTGTLKRAIRRALRWYLWPLTTHMSLHNRAVADSVAENRRQLTRLRLEMERLHHDTGGDQ